MLLNDNPSAARWFPKMTVSVNTLKHTKWKANVINANRPNIAKRCIETRVSSTLNRYIKK